MSITTTSDHTRLATTPKCWDRLRLLSGTANPELTTQIATYLGIELSSVIHKHFADGENYVQIQHSIRGCDVYLVQPTADSVNDHLMELMIMIDACRRASARQITAVIPYYGYSRADRKTAGRESITAKLTANLLTEAGVDRIIAVDLHSAQIEGYFDIPVEHISGATVIADYLLRKPLSNLIVVSPDIGGVTRARAFAKQLHGAPLAIIDKRRSGDNPDETIHIIGDVHGKTAIVIDDLVDTGRTLADCALALRRAGARQVYACATHPLFSSLVPQHLFGGLFEEVIVTNTIPVAEGYQGRALTVLSLAHLLGETIHRIHQESSINRWLQGHQPVQSLKP